MQTAGNTGIPITVELEGMMAYSSIGLVIAILLLVALLVFIAVMLIAKRNKNNKSEGAIIHTPKPHKLEHIKTKYNNMLINIEQKRYANKITDREAYQELSKVIRHFVYDATGIKVQNYTLEEIGRVNIPNLYYLIAECYVPEFAAENVGNVYESINKARKVIVEWS